MFVKPNNGLSVRDPVKGTPLPENGAEVPDNTFWQRRLCDGDVVPAKTTESASASASKKEGTE
jgi:hypothetical protein